MLVGFAALRSDIPVSLTTAKGYAPILPAALAARTETPLAWDSSSWLAVQRSYLRNELRLRSIVRDGEPSLLAAQATGLVVAPNVAQFVHNPEPRPVMRSAALGRLRQRAVVGRSGVLVRHNRSFGRAGDGWWTWPHPVGPASFHRRDVALDTVFPGMAEDGRIRLLVFGRSAHAENLARLLGWIAELPAGRRRSLSLLVSGRAQLPPRPSRRPGCPAASRSACRRRARFGARAGGRRCGAVREPPVVRERDHDSRRGPQLPDRGRAGARSRPCLPGADPGRSRR